MVYSQHLSIGLPTTHPHPSLPLPSGLYRPMAHEGQAGRPIGGREGGREGGNGGGRVELNESSSHSLAGDQEDLTDV